MPAMLTVTVEPEAIVELGRALRVPVSDCLRQSVDALLARGVRRIVVDLSELSDVDAAGVGELVRALNTTRAAGGVLRIARAQARVRRILEISGLVERLSGGGPGARTRLPPRATIHLLREVFA